MDMSETTAARSDQQNFEDYHAGTRTVTITAVSKTGKDEQPVSVDLAEYPGRPFKPNLTMRRLLLIAWGKDTTAYVGRRLTLFGNPAVVYGGNVVGGVEIEAMSHLDKALSVPLTVSRGRKRTFKVAILAAPVQEPVRDWPSEIDATTTTAALTALYQQIRQIPGAYTDELKTAFTDRGAALKAGSAPVEDEALI